MTSLPRWAYRLTALGERGRKRQMSDVLLQHVQADPSPAPALSDLTPEEQARLIDLAVAHRVPGRFHARLNEPNQLLSPENTRRLAIERQRASAMHLITARSMERVAEVLDNNAVDWVVVKGPVIAALYGSPDHRTSTDLDIVVRRSQFVTAFQALADAGFESLNQNWGAFLRHGVAEVPLADGNVVVDLHWHIVGVGSHRNHIQIDIDELINRRRFVSVAGLEIPTLDPEDTLLHLCLHAGMGGGRRLVWLCDIDAVLRRTEIDWDIVVERALRTGQAAMTNTMLRRTRRFFGTPIPDHVLSALGRSWAIAIAERAVDLLRRSDEHRMHGWQSGVVLASTRDSLRSSMQSLSREVRKELALRCNGTDAGGTLDWNVPSGGQHGEERWLDYVASGQR